MKKIFCGMIVVLLCGLMGCNTTTTTQVGKNELPSQPITKNDTPSIPSTPKKSPYEKEMVVAYTEVIYQCETEVGNHQYTYDLIYFNDDEFPDLLVDKQGYGLTIYCYKNHDVHVPFGQLSYGAFGVNDYFYYERGSAINYTDLDQAGAIANQIVMIFDEEGNLIHTFEITTLNQDLENEIVMMEEIQEAIRNEGGYYYSGEKVTAEEYNRKYQAAMQNITGENKALTNRAKKSALEMMAELQGKTTIEVETERDVVLQMGKELYAKAEEFYGYGLETDGEESIRVSEDWTASLITNIEEVKQLLTMQNFERFVGSDDENRNLVVQQGEKYYRVDADRGVNNYYITTILSPKYIAKEEIEFSAFSYYLKEAKMDKMTEAEWNMVYDNPQEFLQQSYMADIDKREDSFVIKIENGTWKVDRFAIPY